MQRERWGHQLKGGTVDAGADQIGEARALADEACALAGVRLENAHDPVAARHAAEVLSRVWGKPGTEMIDPALLVAVAHAGNLVTVANVDGRPVGAAAGFCGPPGSPFHSHIVGLLPSAAGRGIGRALKLAQRAWCLENGISTMTWTYDPLVARNAFFNLHRLGGCAKTYYADFYGDMTDAINIGQPSDRMLICWDLRRDPPGVSAPVDVDPAAHVAVADDGGAPTEYVAPNADSRCALVAVPPDIEILRCSDVDTALRWRLRTREALQDLLNAGWTVTDFSRSNHYVLRREGKP